LCGALAVSATAHEVDKDRDNLTTHDLSGFTQIDVSGVYQLDVTVGEDFSVTTSGSDKEVEFMEIKVKDDTLILGTKERKKSWSIGNRKGLHAVVTLPKLESLDVAGIATGDVTGIDADGFEMDVAGIADMTLSGKCKTFDLDVAGMGEVEAEEFKCANVDVDVAGMGEVSVYASVSVDASAAGMGQVEVYGKPEIVSKSDNFMSKVRIK